MIHPQLLTFISVAENGSFSKAAEAMFISPTAVMIIGTYCEDGTPDAMNAAWGTLCKMNTVALYLSAGHKTVANIKKRGALSIFLLKNRKKQKMMRSVQSADIRFTNRAHSASFQLFRYDGKFSDDRIYL